AKFGCCDLRAFRGSAATSTWLLGGVLPQVRRFFVIFCGAEDGTVGDAGHIGVVDRSQVDIT
ncbi:hypothetical protein, partial [Anaplasma marginale]|uniref:hypothetical protein n=1 Tax=Anaplasma marginale TaxID=770 RepID=UPI0019D6E4A1